MTDRELIRKLASAVRDLCAGHTSYVFVVGGEVIQAIDEEGRDIRFRPDAILYANQSQVHGSRRFASPAEELPLDNAAAFAGFNSSAAIQSTTGLSGERPEGQTDNTSGSRNCSRPTAGENPAPVVDKFMPSEMVLGKAAKAEGQYNYQREAADAVIGAMSGHNKWCRVAQRFGEELVTDGPDHYYEMTAQEWLSWALGVVRETQRQCREDQQLICLLSQERDNLHEKVTNLETANREIYDLLKWKDQTGRPPEAQVLQELNDKLRAELAEAKNLLLRIGESSDIYPNGDRAYPLHLWDEITRLASANPSGDEAKGGE